MAPTKTATRCEGSDEEMSEFETRMVERETILFGRFPDESCDFGEVGVTVKLTVNESM